MTRSARLRHGATILALLGALVVCGCGFHLRGSVNLPFSSVYLALPLNSPLGAELRRDLVNGSSTRVVDTAAAAQAVLEVSGEVRDKQIQALNAQGQAREYQLRYRLTVRVHDGKGHELLGPTPLSAQRDISFNDSAVLSKESEEALLYRDMQSDLVQQILRRLGALKASAAQG
jgi:LPS-assembly lipoprotein